MARELLTTGDYEHVAAAAVYTGQRVHRHVLSEFTNDTEQILATVANHDNLVYAVGQADETGAVKLHGMSSRAGARGHYDSLREQVDILAWKPFTELRTAWYVFYDGVVTMGLKPDSGQVRLESIVLFPMGPEEGILGELAWSIHPDARHADRTTDELPNPPPLTKVENRELLVAMVSAFEQADIQALSGMLSEDVGTALRDYATEQPYHDVQGRSAALQYYEGFFKTFDVSEVELVNRVIGEWFIFSELQWTARPHSDAPGSDIVRFCTATMYPLNTEGRIVAQIGWGTDPVSVDGS